MASILWRIILAVRPLIKMGEYIMHEGDSTHFLWWDHGLSKSTGMPIHQAVWTQGF